MARGELQAIIANAQDLLSQIEEKTELEAWVQSKITKAADYISSVRNYMQGQQHRMQSSSMHDQLVAEEKKSNEIKEACWSGYVAKGTKKKGGRTVPNCVPLEEAKSEAWQRKEGKDPEGGLNAKGVASYWNFPLIRLDMGKIFSGIVGSSEQNMRQVFKIVESVAPCILWCDEIDKGMSGGRSSGSTDGGTTARVLGSWLTWMQDRESPVFVVATANDVSHLPPELLRKGRFDEIFFVDLPSEYERKKIFEIHLAKRNRDVLKFDMEMLAKSSSNFTGAEIESSIEAAMYEAFSDNKRDILTKDILLSLKNTVPISVTMKEQIDYLRKWASERARNASNSDILYSRPVYDEDDL
jgi:hypothetical protein